MASFQIACPHCASTLSFGHAVQAGAVLSCLICNRTFTALAATAAAPTPAAPSRGSASPPVAKAPGMQPIPVAKAPAAPRSTVAARSGKSAAQADRSKTSGGAGRVVGGLVLAAIALLMLGGLGYLFWTNVLADRFADNRKESTPPVVAQAPTRDADQDKRKGLPPPPIVNTKDSAQPPATDGKVEKKKSDEAKDGDLDVADVKKPDKSPPSVLPEPIVKKDKDEDKKIEPAPVIPIKVPAPPIAPGVDAARVDAAIARGLRYLSERQQPDGSWGERPTAYAALAGLTMLECKVPADDPSVRKAALFVRGNVLSANATYDLAAAILFLDRLGDPKDRPLIKALSLRLLSGQDPWGGWNYTCEKLPDASLQEMQAFLKAQRPKALPPPPKPLPEMPATGPAPSLLPSPLTGPLRWNRWGGQIKFSVGDNSNTQFALLAMWVARRHDIPVELPLVCSYQRFVYIQNQDGGWGYNVMANSTSTMTCAGLLGLAMGRGAVPAAGKDKLGDPAIQKGLQSLGQLIGTPSQDAAARPPMQNLYFLWSVERVAMLYDLKTIGGKDWYGWGAQILLANQHADGHWSSTQYTGNNDHVDTCFALLFLNRSNLVSDLTESLRLRMVVRDPEAK